MSHFAAALIALVLSHAVPSFPGVRPALIGKFGKPVFLVVYSLISLATLAAVVWTYIDSESGGYWFEPTTSAVAAVTIVMPLCFLLIVARLARPFGAPDDPNPARGIYRVCRFPGSTGLLIWSGLHLLATGDEKRVLLFSAMFIIAAYAMAKNQYVLSKSENPSAATFLSVTSIIPFAAVLAKRTAWNWAELDYRIPLIAIAAYVGVIVAHPIVFGIDPLYWINLD